MNINRLLSINESSSILSRMEKASPPGTFVATISLDLSTQLVKDLQDQGFEISTPLHTVFSAKKKGLSCTLYKSGKLTVQGKEKGPFIEFYLEPTIIKKFTYTHPEAEAIQDLDTSPHIGIDESGKGDFFGPLCIAGVFAEGQGILKLKQIGVKDSKQLTDSSIKKIATKIRAEFAYHIVKINPAKYNELIQQFSNLNSLLAWGHATTIEQLVEKTECTNVIIDQFANEHVVLTAVKRKKLNLEITQRHRGEEDLVVAAASILARAAFVEALEDMEKKYGQPFPKGASKMTIEAGKTFVRSHGKEQLNLVGKLHFKTLDSILRL